MEVPGDAMVLQFWDGIHDATFMAITKMIDGINYLRREGSKPFTVQFPIIGKGTPES